MSTSAAASGSGFGFDPLRPDLHLWTGLRASVRDRAMSAVDAEISRLQVVKASMIAQCDRTQLYCQDGYKTVGQWVRAVGNTSRGTATFQVQTAKMFAALPKVADAAAGGM